MSNIEEPAIREVSSKSLKRRSSKYTLRKEDRRMAVDLIKTIKGWVNSTAGFKYFGTHSGAKPPGKSEAGQSIVIYAVILTLAAVISIGAIHTIQGDMNLKMDIAEDRISNRTSGSDYEYIHLEALKNISASAKDYKGEYDGKGHTGTVTITSPSSGAVISYGTESGVFLNSTAPTFTDAGSYRVYFKITADGYSPYTGEYTVTISRKSLAIPSFSGTLTYNGKSQSPAVTNYSSSCMTATGTGAATAAGTYTLTFTLKNNNYQWSDSTREPKQVSWSIEKCSLSQAVIGDIPAQTYTGSEIKPTPTVTCNNMELVSGKDFIYSYNNNTTAGTATVIITAIKNGNYTGSKTCTFTIGTKAMTVTATGYSGVYDGKAHTGTVTVKVPGSGYSIKYGNSEGNYTAVSPTYHTDAGTTIVFYQVTADNYSTVTGSFSIKIEKAKISTVPTAKDVPYTGSYVSPVWQNYSSLQLNISGTTRAYMVGTYTVSFSPTANYTWSDGSTSAKSASWKIVSNTGTSYHTAVLYGRDRTLSNYMSVTYVIREDWNKATNSSTVSVTSIKFRYFSNSGADLNATNAYARTTGGAGGSDGHATWFAGSSSIMECNDAQAVIAFVSPADTSWIIPFNNSSSAFLYKNNGNTLATSEALEIAHDASGNAVLTISGYWSWGTVNSAAAFPRDTRGGISNGNLSYATTTVNLTNTKQ